MPPSNRSERILKAVLDNNVIISGIISKSGAPFEIIEAWRSDRFLLLTSTPIISELEQALNYPHIKAKYGLTDNEIRRLIKSIYDYASMVPSLCEAASLAEDPTDEKFIECALAGRADFIASGDKHLLRLETVEDIKVLSPRAFVDTLSLSSS